MIRPLLLNSPTPITSRAPLSFYNYLILCCVFFRSIAFAGDPAPKVVVTPKYRLEVVRVYGTKRTEQLLVLLYQGGGVAFKSVAASQEFVSTLARDSKIEWAPSCDDPRAGSPFASDREVKSFAERCAKLGIVFTRIPSG